MKIKHLLLISGISIGTISAIAQCTPDAVFVGSGANGISPSEQQGIPHGIIGAGYSQTFTVVVPTDTNVNIPQVGPVNVPINSMKINSINGLPTGFSYNCDNSGCSWNGGSNGCFIVTGTPSQAGTFQLKVNSTVNVESPGLPPLIPGGPTDLPASDIATYDLIVDAVGYQVVDATKFAIVNNQPNPFTVKTKITFTLSADEPIKLEVFDMIGNKVFSDNIEGKARTNTYEFHQHNLTPGMYFYAISNGKKTLTNRMIIGN